MRGRGQGRDKAAAASPAVLFSSRASRRAHLWPGAAAEAAAASLFLTCASLAVRVVFPPSLPRGSGAPRPCASQPGSAPGPAMAVEKEKKTCGQVLHEWKEFVWNPRTHQFMGRTGGSWALILLFYFVFYGFLTALFSLTMWVLLQTLDPFFPKYQDRLSIPGMMIRPKTEALDITYNLTDTESWDSYVKMLNTFLEAYNDSRQAAMNEICTPGRYNEQLDNGVPNYPKRACQFNRTVLRDCSGLNDTTYGYQEGRPCILVKMNRVINFYAGAHQPVNISCTAKMKENPEEEIPKEEDAQKLGEIAMFPANGNIDLMYFPYYGKIVHVNYTQPVVAVKFLNFTFNYDHHVECKMNAVNIIANNERDKFAGRVAFKIRVNKD